MLNPYKVFLALFALAGPLLSAPALADRVDLPAPPIRYYGTINGDLAIQMSLTIDAGKVSGVYAYDKVGQNLTLAGTQTKGVIALTESDNAKITGQFSLTVANDGALAGTWKSPDGKRNLAVALTPEFQALNLTASKTGAYAVHTGFIHFTQDSPFHKALNAALEKQAAADQQSLASDLNSSAIEEAKAGSHALPLEAQENPTVMYADDSLVSIRTLLYEFTGGAHGNTTYHIENYAWIGGKLVSLDTSHLLTLNAATMKTLRSLCVQNLTTQNASWPEDVKFDEKSPPDVNFSAEGLLLTFAPYEAGSYAEGTYEVPLPWASVKSLIGNKSAIKSLVK